MKKLIAIAVLAAASACSQSAEEAPAPAAKESAATAEASMAVDGKPDAGTYEISGPDGKLATTQTINADGTLTEIHDGKEVKGTWTKKEPSTYCITLEGEAEATCYTDSMDGDVWRSVNDADPKDAFTVKRIG